MEIKIANNKFEKSTTLADYILSQLNGRNSLMLLKLAFANLIVVLVKKDIISLEEISKILADSVNKIKIDDTRLWA